MRKLIKILNETVVEGRLDEYYDTILKTYKNRFFNSEDAETFVEFLKQNDEHMTDMFGADKLNIEKEDSGTLIIAYFETDSTLALVGLVSTKDKMAKYDIKAIDEWLDRLIEKMKNGKTFMTTPHELSIRLIRHIENRANRLTDYTLLKNIGSKIDISDMGFNLKDKRNSVYRNVTLRLIKK